MSVVNGTCGVFVGLSTLDIIYNIETMPSPDEKIFAQQATVFAGGPALNAAITYSILGGKARVISYFGHSVLADAAREEAEAFGVEITEAPCPAEFSFPVSTVLISGASGERAVVSAPTQAKQQPINAQIVLDEIINSGAKFLMMDGHYVDAKIDPAAFGIDLLVDAGNWKDIFEVIFCPRSVVIAGHAFRASNGSAAPQFAQSHRVRMFAQTGGADAVNGYDDFGPFDITPRQVQAVDTLGAGDVLHGAFAYYYFAQGRSYRDALEHACRVATSMVQFHGPREGVIRTSQEKER
jgi:sugar/nucleoside kinase (ribokinase family)